jgi:hypothetical protein
MAKRTAHKKAAKKKKPAAKTLTMRSTRWKKVKKSARPTAEAKLDRQIKKANAAEKTQYIPPAEVVQVVCSRDPRHTAIDSHVIKAEFDRGATKCGCGAPLVTRTSVSSKP